VVSELIPGKIQLACRNIRNQKPGSQEKKFILFDVTAHVPPNVSCFPAFLGLILVSWIPKFILSLGIWAETADACKGAISYWESR
jgi:hypothetical protein